MNKTELIEALASKTESTKVSTARAVDGLVEIITETLVSGEQVAIIGFGTFSSVKRAARTGRNPATGKKIAIAASKAPKFSPGKILKDAVNK